MRPGRWRAARLSWRHESWRHDLVRSIARVIGPLCASYEQGRRRAVKLRAQLICFTPKLGGPFGQPVRLSRSYLSDLTIGQDFLEAPLRLVRSLPSQSRFGHGRLLLRDQPRAEGVSR